MEYFLFSLSILFSFLAFRPDYLYNKSGLIGIQPIKRLAQAPSIFTSIMDLMNGLALMSMLVWGFINLEWWATLVLLFLQLTIAEKLINYKTAGIFWFLKNLTSAIAVLIATISWMQF